MAFEFACPQGHLLQADPSQAGMQARCPHCSTLMIIPSPAPVATPAIVATPATASSSSNPANPAHPPHAVPPAPAGNEPPTSRPTRGAKSAKPPGIPQPRVSAAPVGLPQIDVEGPAATPPTQKPAHRTTPPHASSPTVGDADAGEELFTLRCPNGHELETPADSFGQRAQCPHCHVEFDLLWEDTHELRSRREAARSLVATQSERNLIYWCVGFALVVILGLFILIALSA